MHKRPCGKHLNVACMTCSQSPTLDTRQATHAANEPDPHHKLPSTLLFLGSSSRNVPCSAFLEHAHAKFVCHFTARRSCSNIHGRHDSHLTTLTMNPFLAVQCPLSPIFQHHTLPHPVPFSSPLLSPPLRPSFSIPTYLPHVRSVVFSLASCLCLCVAVLVWCSGAFSFSPAYRSGPIPRVAYHSFSRYSPPLSIFITRPVSPGVLAMGIYEWPWEPSTWLRIFIAYL